MQDITNTELKEALIQKIDDHEKRDEEFQRKMQVSFDNMGTIISSSLKDIEQLKKESIEFKTRHDWSDNQHKTTSFAVAIVYIILFFIVVGLWIIYIKAS